jgi:putative tricarboxylic transport membrane protein
MTSESRGSRTARSGFLGPRIVAAVLLALAAVLVISALGIRRGGGFSVIGPGTMPLIVAVGLFVLAAVFAVRTTFVPDTDLADKARDEEASTHWPTVGLVGLVLVVYALALNGFRVGATVVPGLGYVVATGLFVPTTARILGSRSLLRDLIIGAAIAVVVYIGFTRFLGVRLPAGVLGPLL